MERKIVYVGVKAQCKNTPPRRLTASFPLVCDYVAGKPVMVSRYVGCFLRLVGGGGGLRGHRLPTIKHFSVSLSRKTAFLPAGYPEDISGLMEVSREFARN